MGKEGSTHPLATIPWLPTPTCNLRLRDSAIFKNRYSYADFRYQEDLERLMGSEFEVERTRLSIYDFKSFNKAFPFYIPLPHHTMSVNGIRETGLDGQYWQVAAQFLLSNKVLGPSIWNNDLQSGHKASKNEKKSHIIKGSIPQCRRPEDFLFEPWILIQLPFQPVLLHQWLVAVFVEVLIFEMEMSEFYNYPFPEEFKIAVSELDIILKALKGNLGFGFDWLQSQAEAACENEIVVGDLVEFTNMLKETLAFLEFRFSVGRTVISALKKLCWSASQSQSKLVELEKTKTAFDERNFLYNWTAWREIGDVTVFGNSSERLVSYEDDLHSKLLGKNTYPTHCRSNVVIGNLIKNFSPQIDIIFFVFDPTCCKLVQNLRNCENATTLMMIRKEEHGILGSILYNKMKVELVDACDKLGSYLCKVSKTSPSTFFEGKYGDANDIDLPKIMCALSKMHDTEKWELQNLLHEVKKNILESDGCSPYFADGSEKIASDFEARIKRIVYETIADHYKIKEFEKEKDEKLREWQIGQYLLPCFVASFLDLCADISVDESTKEWYMRFVDELIASYENFGFSRSSDACIMLEVEQGLSFYMSFNYDHSSMLVRHFRRISHALFAEIQSDTAIAMQKVFSCFDQSISSPVGDQPAPIFWQWLLLDFFTRVREALTSTTPLALTTSLSYEEKKDEIIDLIRLIFVDATCSYDVFELDPDPVQLLRHVLLFSFEQINAQAAAELQVNILPAKFKLAIDENALENEMKTLSERQILSIAFYLALKLTKRAVFKEASKTPKQLFGEFDTAFHSYLAAGNMWALKEYARAFFGNESRVLIDFARSFAPTCYFLALKELSIDSLEAMSFPDDYWYFPIEHCRWCGRADSAELRVCSECEIDTKYPTVNLYCSEQCDVIARRKIHSDEHDHFLWHQIEQNLRE
ncbi:uncharacterized protein LOC135942135 [Cloeon dipterum]|uniref:uncharacterized protein LOC135942135 n=1 Tax=Cloeon dipterum TaxID=197152 RepID=UPI00321F9337